MHSVIKMFSPKLRKNTKRIALGRDVKKRKSRCLGTASTSPARLRALATSCFSACSSGSTARVNQLRAASFEYVTSKAHKKKLHQDFGSRLPQAEPPHGKSPNACFDLFNSSECIVNTRFHVWIARGSSVNRQIKCGHLLRSRELISLARGRICKRMSSPIPY